MLNYQTQNLEQERQNTETLNHKILQVLQIISSLILRLKKSYSKLFKEILIAITI